MKELDVHSKLTNEEKTEIQIKKKQEIDESITIKHLNQNKMRIDEINAMAEEVYLEHENNDILYGDSLELRLAYKAGVVDGYNKAKETLFTKEHLKQIDEKKRPLNFWGVDFSDKNADKISSASTTSIPKEEPEEDEIYDISDHDGIGNAVDNLNNEEPEQETIEEAAERIVPFVQEIFIKGAKSDAARDYWYEQFKKK